MIGLIATAGVWAGTATSEVRQPVTVSSPYVRFAAWRNGMTETVQISVDVSTYNAPGTTFCFGEGIPSLQLSKPLNGSITVWRNYFGTHAAFTVHPAYPFATSAVVLVISLLSRRRRPVVPRGYEPTIVATPLNAENARELIAAA